MNKNHVHLCLLTTALLLFASCQESGGVFTDDTREELQLYDYYIDEYGNEGVVAYVSGESSSERKYIMVISADEANLPWGPMGEIVYKDSISKAGISDSSFGVAMHQAMKSMGIDRFPAQAWCDKKNGGEPHPRAGSWRLPTQYDFILAVISYNKKVDALNSALIKIGGTPLNKEQLYWTCVEDIEGYATIKDVESDYDQANRAVILTPTKQSQSYKDRWLKKNKYNVRAIKYVYYRY